MRYNCLINIIYRLGGGNVGSPFFRSFLGLTSDDTKTLVFLMKNEHFNYRESQQQKPFDDSRLSPELPRIKERRRQSSRQSTSFRGVVTFPSFIFVVLDKNEVSAFNSCPKSWNQIAAVNPKGRLRSQRQKYVIDTVINRLAWLLFNNSLVRSSFQHDFLRFFHRPFIDRGSRR